MQWTFPLRMLLVVIVIFLVEVLTEAIKAGADTLNIPDTVGYSTPEEFGDLIDHLNKNVPGIKDVIISTHCHNDLGLAVANSLAGVRNGARQIECTINGIGERAGNAALEEVIMAMKTRPDLFSAKTNIDTKQLLPTSKMLINITGQQVQSNKAIVGKNAFAHEAGIHQHGMLANSLTYEIMKPEDVGYSSSELVLGKHSGRNALSSRLKELGINLAPEQLNQVFPKFKALADKKKNVYDEDLILLASDTDGKTHYELLTAKITSEKDKNAYCHIELRVGRRRIKAGDKGDGPVSALYNAIAEAADLKGRLKYFAINALTPDREAVGIVNIQWEDRQKKLWHGHGADTDITIAAGKALVDVLNRMEIRRKHDSVIFS